MNLLEEALAVRAFVVDPRYQLNLPPIRFDMKVDEVQRSWVPTPTPAPNINQVDELQFGATQAYPATDRPPTQVMPVALEQLEYDDPLAVSKMMILSV